jgi:hypothetical protein
MLKLSLWTPSRYEQNRQVGRVIRLRAGQPTVHSLFAVRSQIFFTSSLNQDPFPGLTQHFPLQWVTTAISPRVKWPGRETDNLFACSTEVKNEWSYTSTPPYTYVCSISLTVKCHLNVGTFLIFIKLYCMHFYFIADFFTFARFTWDVTSQSIVPFTQHEELEQEFCSLLYKRTDSAGSRFLKVTWYIGSIFLRALISW